MDLRYPIGPFKFDGQPNEQQIKEFISDIEQAPSRLRAALAGLSKPQLETPYRPGGWTLRQVAHHVPESHMNAYVRMKLALTEENPTIKPYDEARWAETPDVRGTPIATSLTLLEALHQRWVTLLRRWARQSWRGLSRIPRAVRGRSANISRSIPGTVSITWHTSPACASALGGNRKGVDCLYLVEDVILSRARTERKRGEASEGSMHWSSKPALAGEAEQAFVRKERQNQDPSLATAPP